MEGEGEDGGDSYPHPRYSYSRSRGGETADHIPWPVAWSVVRDQ
jgi:hypothetical protein